MPSTALSAAPEDCLARALLSLDGLSVGDAFGERFFGHHDDVRARLATRTLPEAPWRHTDDTAMALGIVEVLRELGSIDQDRLAAVFARRYAGDRFRGYGSGAAQLLQAISRGCHWRHEACSLFHGQGSLGNGGAMRVAPLGAYFAHDTAKAVEQARLSAQVTHAHPEGQAGAVAVALAAAWATRASCGQAVGDGAEMLRFVLDGTPESRTRAGIEQALALLPSASVKLAAITLGNGANVSAPDTVPFCLWCAALYPDRFEEALWVTVSALGDRDTTCAIVGGIVALSAGAAAIPQVWLNARETLPL